VHNTFWILDYGQKAVYNTSSTFNEIFQAHYPQLSYQLLTTIASPPIPVAPLNINAEV
jgi:hypothetical protein